ncbi:Serine/threonine-protein phosphatase 7 long form homolog [Linum perenne]
MSTSRLGITLMCYWNGRVSNGPSGIFYEGATPKPIRVSCEITYNELLDKIYGITGFDKLQFTLKIICRYPACREFIAVPIEDDDSVDIVFDVARQPETNCLELYVEKVPIPVDNTPNVVNLLQVDDQVDDAENDQSSDAIAMEVDNQAVAGALDCTDIPVNNAISCPKTDDETSVQTNNKNDTQHLDNHPVLRRTSKRPTARTRDINKQKPAEAAKRDGGADSFLDPGPIDKSILLLQDQHRSEAIWNGQDPGVIKCRQMSGAMMRDWKFDPRLQPYVIQSGFYEFHKLGFIPLDWPLLTALVERWRQETHTFHFPVGESTITLQDVSVLLGIRVHGPAVTGKSDLPWDDLCEELLGIRPDPGVLHGSTIKLSWLRTHLRDPPPDAGEETLRHYARAYLLGLISGVLFTDKSGSAIQLKFLPLLRDFSNTGQLSWGSAALAFLYRELCRATKTGAIEMSGPLILLQLWAWEHLHFGRPEKFGPQIQNSSAPECKISGEGVPVAMAVRVDEEELCTGPLGCRWRSPVIRRDNPIRALFLYRDQIDQLTEDQMIWQPYTSESLATVSDICVRDQHVWRTVAPLICFDIIEWHHPERVLRQFGIRQGIPEHCDTDARLHSIDRRGKHTHDWEHYHRHYLELWEARESTTVVGEPVEAPMQYHDPYMEWYRRITRRLITPLTQRSHKCFQSASGTAHLLVQSLTNIHSRCTTALLSASSDDALPTLHDIQSVCNRILALIGETRHLQVRPTSVPAGETAIRTMLPFPAAASVLDRDLQLNYEKPAPSYDAPLKVRLKNPTTKRRGRSKDDGSQARGTVTGRLQVENEVDELQCVSSEECPVVNILPEGEIVADSTVLSPDMDSNKKKSQETESIPNDDTCSPPKKKKSAHCDDASADGRT